MKGKIFKISQLMMTILSDWSVEDVTNVLHMVFCACDEGDRDGALSLEEALSPVCTVSILK